MILKTSFVIVFLLLFAGCYDNAADDRQWPYGSWVIDKEKSIESFLKMNMRIEQDQKEWIINTIKGSDQVLSVTGSSIKLYYSEDSVRTIPYEILIFSENEFIVLLEGSRFRMGRDIKGVYRVTPGTADVESSEGEYEKVSFDLKLYMKKTNQQ